MKLNTIITSLFVMGMAVLTISCSDFLEEYSQDKAQVETWEDLDELLLGDAHLEPTLYIGGESQGNNELPNNLDILHFMGDELKENPDNETDLLGYRTDKFAFFTWQQDTGVNEDINYIGGDEKYWDMLYQKINICNIVLSLIDEQPEQNADDTEGKARVKGEAYFLRAAYYFLLVNLYARPYDPQAAASTPGVPVKLSEYVEDREFPREPLTNVYAQILADLDNAAVCLEGKSRKSIYHPDLTAVYLFRSRVCLYMQDWETAAQDAQRALDLQDGLLDLRSVAEGENSLSRNSPETIFSMGGYLISIAFADWRSTWGQYYPSYLISDEMAVENPQRVDPVRQMPLTLAAI